MEDFLLLDELFSPEEKLIRDATRRFIEESVMSGITTAYEDGFFPTELIPEIANLGLFGMTLPPELGGQGASEVAYGLVCQELERGDSGLRSFVSVQNSLCMYPIYAYGSEAQQIQWLPKMAKGEVIGCFGLTEPDAGSDPASMKTTAKKVQDGWVLNGSKMWITNATLADIAIVWAKVDSKNIRGFIVEKAFKGFRANEIKHKGSLRASITGELVFEDCFIPEGNLLPKTDKGLSAALGCLTKARYGIAWGVMGAAMDCFERSKRYVLERKQFGKPLASFQLIQKDLVEMFNEINKAQMYNLRVGQLMDKHQANYVMVSLGKMNACREALKIARMARNLLGANGISLEYHVIRHMNNLESVFTYEGTDNMHHLIVGRHLTDISAFE
jgi:glutaryl-CoA dehydrogenase